MNVVLLPAAVLLASAGTVALYILAAIVIAAVVAGIAFLLWLRSTLFSDLLSNVATIELNESDPLVREAQRLQLEYEVAEDLGYPGEILVHLEAQLNAAKLAAAGDPNATMTVFVTPVATVESAPVQAQYFVLPADLAYRPAFLFTTLSSPVYTPSPSAG